MEPKSPPAVTRGEEHPMNEESEISTVPVTSDSDQFNGSRNEFGSLMTDEDIAMSWKTVFSRMLLPNPLIMGRDRPWGFVK